MNERQFLISERIGPFEPCHRCGGLGVRVYANTTTWRGGIGGQAMTSGVCDHCWGSGCEERHWPSHREVESDAKELAQLRERHERALDRCRLEKGPRPGAQQDEIIGATELKSIATEIIRILEGTDQ